MKVCFGMKKKYYFIHVDPDNSQILEDVKALGRISKLHKEKPLGLVLNTSGLPLTCVEEYCLKKEIDYVEHILKISELNDLLENYNSPIAHIKEKGSLKNLSNLLKSQDSIEVLDII